MFTEKKDWEFNSIKVQPGTELTIKNKGRMKFRAFVCNQETGRCWVDCFDKDSKFNSFAVTQIKRVHRKNKMVRRY